MGLADSGMNATDRFACRDEVHDARIGCLLAVTTAITWGTLPIALKFLLSPLDAYTITCVRFATACIVLAAILMTRHQLSLPPAARRVMVFALLGVAALGLGGNHVVFLWGLRFVSAEAAQVLIQSGPMFLLLGGIVLFGEPFSNLQWCGLALLVLGTLIFFHDAAAALLHDGVTGWGYGCVILAALLWALYGLAQKKLLRIVSSLQLMFLIYATNALLLWPLVDAQALRDLPRFDLFVLAYCACNTLVGYGSFAEAMRRWEVSRVSAIVATAPLWTLAFAKWGNAISPRFDAQPTDVWMVVGACLVVFGSCLAALGRVRKK